MSRSTTARPGPNTKRFTPGARYSVFTRTVIARSRGRTFGLLRHRQLRNRLRHLAGRRLVGPLAPCRPAGTGWPSPGTARFSALSLRAKCLRHLARWPQLDRAHHEHVGLVERHHLERDDILCRRLRIDRIGAVSPDGITWTNVGNGLGGNLRAVAWNREYFSYPTTDSARPIFRRTARAGQR